MFISPILLLYIDRSRLPETEGKELPPAVIMKLDVEGRVRKLFWFKSSQPPPHDQPDHEILFFLRVPLVLDVIFNMLFLCHIETGDGGDSRPCAQVLIHC